jgi:hypothetical protein
MNGKAEGWTYWHPHGTTRSRATSASSPASNPRWPTAQGDEGSQAVMATKITLADPQCLKHRKRIKGADCTCLRTCHLCGAEFTGKEHETWAKRQRAVLKVKGNPPHSRHIAI